MRREFVLIVRGIVDDLDNSDLSDENLRLNLEHVFETAVGNGMVTGESSAEIEKIDHTITISDMR